MGETTPSGAMSGFAIWTFADADFDALGGQLERLAARPGAGPLRFEALGNPASGEVALRVDAPPSAGPLPAWLPASLDALALRIHGRFCEPPPEPPDRFPVRVDCSAHPREALATFRARMGLQPATPPYQLRFESGDDIAAAWARCLAEGSLFVATRRPPKETDTVALLLVAPDVGSLSASGFVLHVEAGAETPGFLALIAPGDGLQSFLARRAAAAHHGRRQLPEGARRRAPRYQTCLEIEFAGYPDLTGEYASNISRGGLFIRTSDPPPLRARVQLRVKLPGGRIAESEAEVVHRVGPDEARAQSGQPGVGVCFVGENSAFQQQIAEFLAALPARPPRVLLVDDDRLFRGVLADALRAAGMEVDTAASGEEGLQKLTQQLFDLDLVGLELHMPGLDGYCLIDRIRRLGGEMDLRVVVISAAEQDELDALKGADAANECIRKGVPLQEMVRRIQGVLGLERTAAP